MYCVFSEVLTHPPERTIHCAKNTITINKTCTKGSASESGSESNRDVPFTSIKLLICVNCIACKMEAEKTGSGSGICGDTCLGVPGSHISPLRSLRRTSLPRKQADSKESKALIESTAVIRLAKLLFFHNLGHPPSHHTNPNNQHEISRPPPGRRRPGQGGEDTDSNSEAKLLWVKLLIVLRTFMPGLTPSPAQRT